MDFQLLQKILIDHYDRFNINEFELDQLIAAENEIDQVFGICHNLGRPSQTEYEYADLNNTALNSSYIDLMHFLKVFDGNEILDVGAGCGRLGFVIGLLYPHINYYASEISSTRIEALEHFRMQFNLPNLHIYRGDYLSDQHLLQVDALYLYLPWEMIHQIMLKLIESEKSKTLWVVESHGDVIDQLESRPYLRRLQQLKLTIPRHHQEMSAYRFDYNKWLKKDLDLKYALNQQPEKCPLAHLQPFVLADHSLDDYFISQDNFLYSTHDLQKDKANYLKTKTSRYIYMHQQPVICKKSKIAIDHRWLDKLRNNDIIRIDLQHQHAEISPNNWIDIN
jgi:hypothetical protein